MNHDPWTLNELPFNPLNFWPFGYASLPQRGIQLEGQMPLTFTCSPQNMPAHPTVDLAPPTNEDANQLWQTQTV